MSTQDYEKLGVFYLGQMYDLANRRRLDDPILYDSKDLVTHAVCVGMTGSGKTGLGIALLEEAAIDQVPALVIDPKGDLPNLLLNFPQLRGSDFAPWINEDDARRKGVSPVDYAEQQATLWKDGLAEWRQDGARIQRLRDAADFAVYTPGSNAGLPISVLKSFAAPPGEILEDSEAFHDRVTTTVSSLLGLLGIKADPLQSREHILMANLLGNAWAGGRNLDLPSLIQEIHKPPMARVGVLEIETFYPAQERFGLAIQLNNLIASPGFARWMDGDPLDIGALLHSPSGKPRVSIFSIAHLSEAERMFFVSLLLNQLLGWVRMQSGTTSLRALLYMDEIAGYCPPVAEPPSKKPLLTLMKQARAFGVGLVLATQNPVDLDYKGLGNAGTWFIGKLQTERDKARVLDGLEGAAASASAEFDRASIERVLSQFGNRIFLMNNVHESAPVVMETRWTLSYLRGPLTRNQIKTLMDPRRRGDAAPTGASAPTATRVRPTERAPAPTPAALSGASTTRPVLPPEIPQFFAPPRSIPAGAMWIYQPMLMGSATIRYRDAKVDVDVEEQPVYLAAFGGGPVPVDWMAATEAGFAESEVQSEPMVGASFAPLPAAATKLKSYDAWNKDYVAMLANTRRLDLLLSPGFKASSKPGEPERDFRGRLAQLARERRDALAEKLRQKYASKTAMLQERLRRAHQAVEAQQQQASQARTQTIVSFGATLLSAFTGRKVSSAGTIGRAATAMRGAGRSMKESSDVGRAEENVEAVKKQLAELDARFQGELDALGGVGDPTTETLEQLSLSPKKANISVRAVALVWVPVTTRY
jgi:hypothetical protein